MPTTYVQHRTDGAAIDPKALTYNSFVTAGNMLYAFFVDLNTSASVSGITDTSGNTWTFVAGGVISSYRAELWKAVANSTGTPTVTADYNATPNGSITIYEFSGMGTPTDGPSNTLDVSTASDPLTLATLTTTAAGVIFTGVRIDATYSFVAWQDGFTDAGSTSRIRVGYRVTTGGVSAAPAIDMSGVESGESLTVAMYEEAAGGGGGFRSRIAGGFVLTGG